MNLPGPSHALTNAEYLDLLTGVVGSRMQLRPATRAAQKEARQITCYIAHTYGRLSKHQIARLHGMHHTTVLHAIDVTAERIECGDPFTQTVMARLRYVIQNLHSNGHN